MITKIHGKFYDLKSFKHPGGEIALKHAENRDATVLFESHHPFASKQMLRKILEKYEIVDPKIMKQCSEDERFNTPVDFRFDSSFATELVTRVKQYFASIGGSDTRSIVKATKATWSKCILVTIFAISHFISYCLWISGEWISLVLYPLTAWLLIANVFHDACHFAFSINPRVNELFGYMCNDFTLQTAWYHQHNIGHHSYTNIHEHDPDLHHMEYLMRTTYRTAYRVAYKFQYISVLVLEWTMSFAGIGLLPLINRVTAGRYYETIPNMNIPGLEKRSILLFISVIILKLIPLFIFDSTVKAIVFIISLYVTTSGLFMFNTQLTHIHEMCMEQDDDWYRHQVITSCNHSIGDGIMDKIKTIFSGGLNYQIEHHLFPNINHVHHPKIRDIVQEVCQKHGVEYRRHNGYMEAFRKYYRYMIDLSYPTKLSLAH